MKKKILLLTLSTMVIFALSFTPNTKHISENELPRITSNTFV